MRPCGLTVIVLALLIAPAAGATAPRSASLAGVPAAGAQQRPPICQFLPFPPGCRQPPSQPPPDPRGIDPSSPNPLRGLRFFVDPQEPSFRDYLRFRQSGAQALADRMLKLAGQPKFRWFGRFNHDLRAAVRGYVDRAAARGEVPLLVTLRHQGRQCNPRYTAGGAAEDERTKRWFEDFARAVGGSRVVIGFEPDSVGTVECLARSRRRARLEVLRHGVDVLSRLPNATIYLEATASDWKSAALVAGRLRYIGIAKVRGFMLNATHYAWTASNIRYGLAVSSRVGGKPFVISTAMNGRGPVHYRRTVNRRKRTYRRINVHCHPLYRGLGPSPTTDTSHPKVDAYLWINRPGYSGGSCNGGPVPVGRWWQARALMFARYATSWERPPPGTRFGFPTGRLSINRAAGDQYKP